MPYTTHATLLERLSDDLDPTAWREFHDCYAELIHGFARRQGQQRSDCDDIVQDVLLAVFKSMGRFRYDPARGKFRSYLKTLTLRAVFRNRRQQSRPELLGRLEDYVKRAAEDPAIEARWEDEWRQHHIRQAMRRLKPEFNEQDRVAFSFYVMQGRTALETAAALGLSVNQVYQAKSRILRRLSETIAEQIESEG